MRFSLNLILAGIVVVLAVLWFFIPDPQAAAERDKLTALSRAAVDRISIEHVDADLIVLEKEQGIWRLTAPITARADDFQVGNLLELTSRHAQASYAATDIPFDQAGLGPPQFRVRFNDVVLNFGTTDPLNNQRYVQVAERVHLIADVAPSTFDANPLDLLDKRPLPPDMDIHSMDFGWLKLTRQDNGSWGVTPAEKDRGADAAQALADAWARARGGWIAPLDKDEKFMATYRFTSDKREIELSRVVSEELILARRDLGLQYHMPEALRSELLEMKPPRDATEGAATEAAPDSDS